MNEPNPLEQAGRVLVCLARRKAAPSRCSAITHRGVRNQALCKPSYPPKESRQKPRSPLLNSRTAHYAIFDLDHFLIRKSVTSVSQSCVERCWRWCDLVDVLFAPRKINSLNKLSGCRVRTVSNGYSQRAGPAGSKSGMSSYFLYKTAAAANLFCHLPIGVAEKHRSAAILSSCPKEDWRPIIFLLTC